MRTIRWCLVPPMTGLALACSLILLAHPFFALGVWSDTQTMVAALYAAAALCLAGIAVSAGSSRLARRAALHPAVLVPLALALWSLCAAPLADQPWRSVFGPAQSGQGGLWYVALSAITASALMIRPFHGLWVAVLTILSVSSVIAAVLGLQGLNWLFPWLADNGMAPSVRLLQFNEYLSYPAMGLAVAALARWREGGGKSALIFGTVALLLLFVSRNRTAWLSLPFILCLCLLGRTWLSSQARTGMIVAMAVLVAGSAIFLLVAAASEGVTPDNPLWSRGIILRSLFPFLGDGGWPWVAGRGWGAVPDEMIRHLPASGIRLFASEWGGIERDIFHSHNAGIEAFLSTGMPGLALAVLLPLAVLAGGARHRWLAAALALSWTVLDSFWFMIPASLPAIALGMAAVAGIPRPSGRWCFRSGLTRGVAGGLALVCAGTCVALVVAAVQEQRMIDALASEQVELPPGLPLDIRGDGRALALIMGTVIQAGADTADSRDPVLAQRLVHVLERAERRADAQDSLALSLVLLNAIAVQAFAPPDSPLAWSDSGALSEAWKHRLLRILRQAPARLDLASPYFNWLVLQQRDRELSAVLAEVKPLDGQHPVLLWFEGVSLLRADDPASRAAGLEHMRRALNRGLERMMPVEGEVKAALGLS